MRAQIDRVVAALCMGRIRKAALAEVAAAFAFAAILWVAACAFVALEPVPTASSGQEDTLTRDAPAGRHVHHKGCDRACGICQ
ncbi:MAG: hypothetical protein KYX64_03785 [Sphingopyxis sp.]|nr:hypothetical protein [Sphingopyxis sp.]